MPTEKDIAKAAKEGEGRRARNRFAERRHLGTRSTSGIASCPGKSAVAVFALPGAAR